MLGFAVLSSCANRRSASKIRAPKPITTVSSTEPGPSRVKEVLLSAPVREGSSTVERAHEPSGVQVGARAPEFHGSAPRQIQGSNLHGELVLVYFWASWCRACAEEIGEIQRLHEAYGERGLEVIGVSIDLDPRDMQEFQENHPTTFLNFWDLDVINVNTWEPSGIAGCPRFI